MNKCEACKHSMEVVGSKFGFVCKRVFDEDAKMAIDFRVAGMYGFNLEAEMFMLVDGEFSCSEWEKKHEA